MLRGRISPTLLGMSPRLRRNRNDEQDPSDTTPELTGDDASADEAEVGSAGNGANPFEATDLQGTTRQSRSIEQEGEGEDIGPDRVDQYPELNDGRDEDDDDAEVTARPSDHAEPDFSLIP